MVESCKEVSKACSVDREQHLFDQCGKIEKILERNNRHSAFDSIEGMAQKSTWRMACIKDESKRHSLSQ